MLKMNDRISRLGGLILVLIFALGFSAAASAQILSTLSSFNGIADGEDPQAGLVADANGNLFGTTYGGGEQNLGTVFEIVINQCTSTGCPITTLHSFSGVSDDGSKPVGGLIMDASGNLYGTTEYGGSNGSGTVFEFSPSPGPNGSIVYSETVLASFSNEVGEYPMAGLLMDARGNLFGTASLGGSGQWGTVFELAKDTTTPTGYASTPTVIASFDLSNGGQPWSGLMADANGNLFGTTRAGNVIGGVPTNPDCLESTIIGCGTVFEIVNTGTPATPNYADTATTLVNFNSNGKLYAGLIADANGNLFGTSTGISGHGTVYEILNTGTASAPNYGDPSSPNLRILVSFNITDGAFPHAGLIMDANGSLFGTTTDGGADGRSGTAFEIVNRGTASAPDYGSVLSPNLRTLVDFNNSDDKTPYGGLIADALGNLYGTTREGGANNLGTVFEISASGFLSPKNFVGTPGTPNCQGKSISYLAQAYGGAAHAASSLGFNSVTELQTYVANYCGK